MVNNCEIVVGSPGESTIRLRRRYLKRVVGNLDKISLFFGVKLVECCDVGGGGGGGTGEGGSEENDCCPSQFAYFSVIPLLKATSPERRAAPEISTELQGDLLCRIQVSNSI